MDAEKLGKSSRGGVGRLSASAASPSRRCFPERSSESNALWKSCVGSLRLNPLGEKAAMAPFPSALTSSSASELK
jgi:hypothetical protein